MANKKIYILTVLLTIIFLFTIAFNFSSAFTGAEKQALIESLVKQILIIKEKILEIQRQLLVLISNQIQSEDKKIISELNIQSNGAKTAEDYYKSFIDSLIKINFNEEELKQIKKDEDERVLLLEELAEQASLTGNLDELRISFRAWHRLDEDVITELKKIPINSTMVSLHQWMIDWYQYHSQLAQKFGNDNLTKGQITQLIEQFKGKADIHNSKFKNSLAELKNSPDFVLIPTAQAFTCAAFMGPFYHFGGRDTVMYPCDFGIVEIISPPCGGMLLFTYAVLAANPYLYKKPTIDSAVLGRSVVAPGICPLGVCPACTLFPYEAIVLYFGTSLTP